MHSESSCHESFLGTGSSVPHSTTPRVVKFFASQVIQTKAMVIQTKGMDAYITPEVSRIFQLNTS